MELSRNPNRRDAKNIKLSDLDDKDDHLIV
jgi:hypothetical protein